jgi:deoxyadenosine/deoxycytidine kinase
VFIAFMGMPGCGKSSTAKQFGQIRGYTTFLEPEEAEWGQVVRERDLYGNISALTWFRNTRIVGYHDAYRLHLNGGDAVVDSLFDKLLYKYMDDPSLEWLISRSDPYRAAAKALASADYRLLPDPTHVVFVHVDRVTWREMLRVRGRDLDARSDVENNFAMQEVMFQACQEYCHDKGIAFELLRQEFSSPSDSAEELRKLSLR